VDEVLNRGVARRKEQALVAVIPPANEIRRVTGRAPHLDDLTVSIGFTDVMALDDDAVSDACVHVVLLGFTLIVRAVRIHTPGS
jgi:hypothetical protein